MIKVWMVVQDKGSYIYVSKDASNIDEALQIVYDAVLAGEIEDSDDCWLECVSSDDPDDFYVCDCPDPYFWFEDWHETDWLEELK